MNIITTEDPGTNSGQHPGSRSPPSALGLLVDTPAFAFRPNSRRPELPPPEPIRRLVITAHARSACVRSAVRTTGTALHFQPSDVSRFVLSVPDRKGPDPSEPRQCSPYIYTYGSRLDIYDYRERDMSPTAMQCTRHARMRIRIPIERVEPCMVETMRSTPQQSYCMFLHTRLQSAPKFIGVRPCAALLLAS